MTCATALHGAPEVSTCGIIVPSLHVGHIRSGEMAMLMAMDSSPQLSSDPCREQSTGTLVVVATMVLLLMECQASALEWATVWSGSFQCDGAPETLTLCPDHQGIRIHSIASVKRPLREKSHHDAVTF